MNTELYIHTLRTMRGQYKAEHMETETEALDAAIQSLQTQTEVIRCNDCKKAPKCYGDVIMKSKGGGFIYCPVEYCSEAERRTDG